MNGWKVQPLEGGGWSILCPHGTERARFRDAETMAAHVCCLMEQIDWLRKSKDGLRLTCDAAIRLASEILADAERVVVTEEDDGK
jgi:hypothetical protein